mgnify:FL=1
MTLIETYQSFIDFFPSYIGTSLNLLIIIMVVVLYSFFIWKFQKFISRKNIINLDLNKYNKIENPLSTKLRASALYFLEYILIIPIIIFIIYVLFTFSLLIFINYLDTSTILAISAIIIVSIRILSYYKENLSQEVAKLLPFNLLAVAILNPNTFSQTQYLEKILGNISSIPSVFSQIFYYLFFIIIIEVVLRFFDFIFSLFGLEEIEHEAD